MSEATQAQEKLAPGTFCWNELMTRDAATAKKFYTELFGWTTEDSDMGEMGTYTMIKNGDKEVGGMMQMGDNVPEQVPAHWLSYIAVDDVDATVKKATDMGANICVPPTDIPNIGRFSVFTDPTGAGIAVYTSACGG